MSINEVKTDFSTAVDVHTRELTDSMPFSILVVDDEDAMRKGLAYLLRSEGYKTLEAKNGQEAVDRVGDANPDLILLDLMMPELSGLEVCRLLKGNEATRLIPIVMITALHNQEEKIKAIDAGVDDFLNKPINILELRARVKSLLRMKRLNDLLCRADAVIASLANAIEAKDKYTEGHNERVSWYAGTLARALGLSDNDIKIIVMAGILHDIGKIGVPDSILNKSGSLDAEEQAIIHLHPLKGEKILNPLHLLKEVREIVMYHHERYDGKGYPKGLKGEQIPLFARIVAVADTYDAMTSDRPYRKALTKREAWNELKAKAGDMWDPELIAIFIRIEQATDEATQFQSGGS